MIPTATLAGPRKFIDLYVINLTANTPVALPSGPPATAGPNQPWDECLYVNQSSGSPPPAITLGDANVGTNGGISIAPGQQYTDLVLGGVPYYAVATAAAQLLVQVAR